MAFGIRVTGLKQAVKELELLPAEIKAAAESAVNSVAEAAREAGVRKTLDRYTLDEETIRDAVFVRRASISGNRVSGSVQFQINAVPLSAFDTRVAIVNVPVRAFGRKVVLRKLHAVNVRLYRGRNAKTLPGGFPLKQRSAGALRDGEKVRRRVGNGFGVRNDGTLGTKLTGFRYYTFPKRITGPLLKELQREAEAGIKVALRVAYRKKFRDRLKVLRLNN